MMHFEDFWNHAEALSLNFSEEDVNSALVRIQEAIDKLPQMSTLPSRQAEIVGEILFDLCAITNKLNINSAAALRWAIENRKAELLDPEEGVQESYASNVP